MNATYTFLSFANIFSIIILILNIYTSFSGSEPALLLTNFVICNFLYVLLNLLLLFRYHQYLLFFLLLLLPRINSRANQ